MDKKLAEKLLREAEIELNTGDCFKALKLIEPLLAEGDPAALFLYSHFSLLSLESDEEFEKRSIEMLKTAAGVGYLPAIYSLAVCYELGDRIAMDKLHAADLYKKAYEAGYFKAKLDHGLNIYYGSYGTPKDTTRGLELIRQAALEGDDKASDVLKELVHATTPLKQVRKNVE